MKTLEQINQEITNEKERSAARIQELQARQETNKQLYQDAHAAYVTALAAETDELELAKLRDQVDQAERMIRMNDEAIAALKNGSPRIQQLEAERFYLLISKSVELEQKAAEIHETLKQHHDALSAGVNELNSLYHEWYKIVHGARRILEQFDGPQKEKLGLPIQVTNNNPVVALLNSLLIERQQAFTRG